MKRNSIPSVRRLFMVLLVLAAAGSPSELRPANLGPRPVLVELFTSQGCSSCPPADALLAAIGRDPAFRGHVVPLAFHVDYWDHLGWRDPFSSPAWSARQQEYGRLLGSQLYTPQVVVNGAAQAVGSDSARLHSLIEQASRRSSPATVEIRSVTREAGGSVRVAVRASAPEPARAFAAVYQNGASTAVAAGENVGRTLANDFVVRRLQLVLEVGPGGQQDAIAAVPVAPGWTRAPLGIAVFLQSERSHEIVAAAARPISADR
jgi:hypothetical protein